MAFREELCDSAAGGGPSESGSARMQIAGSASASSSATACSVLPPLNVLHSNAAADDLCAHPPRTGVLQWTHAIARVHRTDR